MKLELITGVLGRTNESCTDYRAWGVAVFIFALWGYYMIVHEIRQTTKK